MEALLEGLTITADSLTLVIAYAVVMLTRRVGKMNGTIMNHEKRVSRMEGRHDKGT